MPRGMTHLNFNEMPLPPDGAILSAMRLACEQVNHYPEWDSSKLIDALAEYNGVPSNWITVGNGSLMTVHQIMIASGQREVVYGWPSFDDYPVMAEGLDMKIRPTSLCTDGSCDLGELSKNITKNTSLAIICTPNTPTGGVVAHKDAEDFLAKVPPHVTVMIDEAYFDFVTDEKALRSVDLATEHPNVVVSRSFSKGLGLAGLRIGYSIAQPELTKRIAAAGVPKFHLSHVSLAGALAALQHPQEMRRRIAAIVAERQRLTDALRALGATVVAGQGNFVWLPIGKKAAQVAESLAAEGVLVRSLMPYGVRVSVGTSEDTDRLIAAWRKKDPLN